MPAPSPTDATNVGFPDASLVVSYAAALRYVRHRLRAFPHGSLKAWALAGGFNYARLFELKKLEEESRSALLKRLLEHFGFPVDVLCIIVHEARRHFFLFGDAAALVRFKVELAFFDNPPADFQPTASPTFIPPGGEAD